MLRVGIVGLPNAGKSTLFNALTGSRQADVAAYPFCTIEPNVGVIEVRDERLEEVRRLFESPRAVPSAIEFVDIAGLVAGASTGEGLGNRFLGHIREVDAIAHVVRCFEREGVPRAEGSVDPVADAQTVETELALADLGTVERRRERTARRAHAGERDARDELSRLDRFRAALDAGTPARAIEPEPGDHELLGELFLLTGKPVIYVVNTGEELIGADDERVGAVQAHAAGLAGGGADAMAVCADLEAEVGDLEPDDAAEFLSDAGIAERGIDRLVRHAYRLLGLITFFTANETEAHAWAIPDGTGAARAAGSVHSDMEQGFIRAEVVGYEDLSACGGMAQARDRGVLRVEGRDYEVRDGDTILFRFR